MAGDAWQLAQALESCATVRSGSVLLYFTGCRGFRLLWLDPTLACPVKHGAPYHKEFLRTVAPAYYHTTLGLPAGFVSKLDSSIYESNKGSKPDLTRHAKSGLVPVLVPHCDGEAFAATCIVDAVSVDVSAELSDAITLFWRSVPTLLTADNLRDKSLLGQQHASELLTSAPARPGRRVAQSCVTGPVELTPDVIASIRAGQAGWSQLQTTDLQVKQLSSRDTCIAAPMLRYCAVARREHSQSGKVYFLLSAATGRLTQRCHSHLCSTAEHEIVGARAAAAAAAGTVAEHHKRLRATDVSRGLNQQSRVGADSEAELDSEQPELDDAEYEPGYQAQRQRLGQVVSDSSDWKIQLQQQDSPAGGEMKLERIQQAALMWCASSTTATLLAPLQQPATMIEDGDVVAFQLERQLFMAELMLYLNRFWSVVTKLSKPVYVDRVQVAGGGSSGGGLRSELVLRGKDAFHEVYTNRTVTLWTYDDRTRSVQRLTKPLSALWLLSPLRREYDVIECDPSPTASERNLNLWQGMAISRRHCDAYRRAHPSYTDEAAPFLDHLRTIWCRGDEACFRYVMGWFAMTIQRPEVKIGVALVVVGAPGAGKGVVVTDFLARIVGDHHYAHVMGIEQLLGRFSSSTTLANKLKLVDECTWAGRKEDAARLKTIITEDTAYVEKKFMDGMNVRSLCNLLIFSNDSFAVHVERKDRRFCSLETDNRFSGAQTAASRAYFDRLRAVPVEAVASVLYQWNLSHFHSRQFPHTAFRQAQQIEAFVANSVEKWFMECLDREQLPPVDVHLMWEHKRIKESVYQDYKHQAGPHPKPSHVFWKELATMAAFATSQDRQAGRPSVQLVKFEPLQACRDTFRAAMGAQEWVFQSEVA